MGTTSMVNNSKWRVHRSGRDHAWVATAPNGNQTRHFTHTSALEHATRWTAITTATRRTEVITLILQAILRGREPTADSHPSLRPPPQINPSP